MSLAFIIDWRVVLSFTFIFDLKELLLLEREFGFYTKVVIFFQVLGVPEGNITVLSYSKLRDDPSVRWREEVVSEAVLAAVHSNEVDTVLTFDRHGVSGHKNHASIYNAMA